MLDTFFRNFPNPAAAGKNSSDGSFGKTKLHSEAFLSLFSHVKRFGRLDEEGLGKPVMRKLSESYL